MTVHEYGKRHQKTVLLIHPSVVMWDYFEYVIPLMKEAFHLVIPALPGYDPNKKSDFTSIEQIAGELEDWLIERNLKDVACVYGCSMGGSVILKMLANNRLKIQSAIIDGGITPYELPWMVTRLIAVKDFFMITMGKMGGVKLLQRAFSTDEFSDEDLQYAAKVLKMMSMKTIWRTFESCNNYSMPKSVQTDCKKIEYWFSDIEENARKADIAYIKKMLPQVEFKRIMEVGHGGLAIRKPEKLAEGIRDMCEGYGEE